MLNITKLSQEDLDSEQMAFANFDKKAATILEVLYAQQTDVEALSYIFEIIEQKLSERNLKFVDSILLHLNPNRCEIIISTGILRCCSRVKNLVSHFETAKERVKYYIDSQHLDSKRLLRGL